MFVPISNGLETNQCLIGINENQIYEDRASGKREDRPGLDACLKALRKGDTLVIWKLDRLGRDMAHLVSTVRDLEKRGVAFKVLTEQGVDIDTSTPAGRLIFGIFASLAEFERDLIRERVMAGLSSARARGRRGGAPYKMTTQLPPYSLIAIYTKFTQYG
ncbi:MAG: recombinase family protein [Magnetococcales bacterium]|nr:recombinase family protein [Magnetococcales bacterium]